MATCIPEPGNCTPGCPRKQSFNQVFVPHTVILSHCTVKQVFDVSPGFLIRKKQVEQLWKIRGGGLKKGSDLHLIIVNSRQRKCQKWHIYQVLLPFFENLLYSFISFFFSFFSLIFDFFSLYILLFFWIFGGWMDCKCKENLRIRTTSGGLGAIAGLSGHLIAWTCRKSPVWFWKSKKQITSLLFFTLLFFWKRITFFKENFEKMRKKESLKRFFLLRDVWPWKGHNYL